MHARVVLLNYFLGVSSVAMGVSTQASLDFLGNGEIMYNPSGPLITLEEAQGRKQRVISTEIKKGRTRRRRILMNRRLMRKGRRLQRQSCRIKPAQKRITALRKLVLMSGSTGLEGLFREAADYIVSLQIRVKAMQVMINALSCSDE